jgi:tRNA A-37 threonylcarbamoyl transferase component Bud32
MTEMTTGQLKSLPHGYQGEFQIDLPGSLNLRVSHILRLLPGKRIVGKAILDDKTVLAKLFFKNGASGAAEREAAGLKLLSDARMQTPKLLKTLEADDITVFIYEFMPDAQGQHDALDQLDGEAFEERVRSLIRTLCDMHEKGIYQKDLHLDNFIMSGGELFVIDPGSVRGGEGKYSTETSLDNLALFVAQFPVSRHHRVIGFIARESPVAADTLALRVAHIWQKRIQHFVKKLYRDCTYTREIIHEDKNIYCVRDRASDAMLELLRDPQSAADKGKQLKIGNSSVVAVVDVDGQSYVVKCYKYKSVIRGIRRSLRRSRASNSWMFAHLVKELGLQTPEPIALVERRQGPFVMNSWYISEFVAGEDLLGTWGSREPEQSEFDAVEDMFKVLRRVKVSHGDMKATNLILTEGVLNLIDFDGMRQHRKTETFEKRYAKDRARFLKNWTDQTLLDKLEQVIPS